MWVVLDCHSYSSSRVHSVYNEVFSCGISWPFRCWAWLDLSLGVLRETALAAINKLVIDDNVNICAQHELMKIIYVYHLRAIQRFESLISTFEVTDMLESGWILEYSFNTNTTRVKGHHSWSRGDRFRTISPCNKPTGLHYSFVQTRLDAEIKATNLV